MNRGDETPARVWDPGVQNERTSLAWTRTCLAYAGCSLLCARLASSAPLATVVATVGVAAAMGLLGRTYGRYHRTSTALFAGRPVTATRQVLILTAMTVVLEIAALVLIVGTR